MRTPFIVGCGSIVRSAYVPALSAAGCDQVSVYDRDESSALALARDNTESGVDIEIAERLEDGLRPDRPVILVLPPTELPAVVARLATAQAAPGLDVLIEKPMGATFEAGERMLTQLARSGVNSFYLETFLYSAAAYALREQIESGDLGELSRLDFSVPGSTPPDLDRTWRGERELGGGVWHDWGIHSVGLCLDLLAMTGVTVADAGASLKENLVALRGVAADFGARRVLVDAAVESSVTGVEIGLSARWGKFATGQPAVIASGANGCVELHLESKDGSSNWVAIRDIGGHRSRIAERLYPKELFRTGLTRFLTCESGCVDGFSNELGLTAVDIADHCYGATSWRNDTSSR